MDRLQLDLRLGDAKDPEGERGLHRPRFGGGDPCSGPRPAPGRSSSAPAGSSVFRRGRNEFYKNFSTSWAAFWPSSQTLSTVDSVRESPQIKAPGGRSIRRGAGTGRAVTPAMARGCREVARRDAPDLLMPVDQAGQIGLGRGIGIFPAVARCAFNHKNGLAADDPSHFVVLAIARLDGLATGQNPSVAFAGAAQVGSGIFKKGDQARIIIGGRLGQAKDARRFRTGAGN